MRISSVSNYQTFKQKASDITKEKSASEYLPEQNSQENKSKLGKAIFYTASTAIGALFGSLHGVYKKITKKEKNIKFIIEPAEGDLVRLRIMKITEPADRIKAAVLVPLGHSTHAKPGDKPFWKFINDNELFIEKGIINKYKPVKEFVLGKPEKIMPIEEINEISCFKKIIDPAEANFLENLSKIKKLQKPIEFYNKSKGLIKEFKLKSLKNLYYDKELVKKGAIVVGSLALLLTLALDKLINRKQVNKKENENIINK